MFERKETIICDYMTPTLTVSYVTSSRAVFENSDAVCSVIKCITKLMIWSFLLIGGSLFYYSPLSRAIVAAPLVKGSIS